MSEYDDLLEPTEADVLPAASVEEVVAALPDDTPAGDDSDLAAAIPQEPEDDDTPPDDAVPAFVIVPNAYGPGVDSVKLASGVPVGRWLNAEHAELDGGQVAEMLLLMGMDGDRAAWFGLQRDRAREATGVVMKTPGVRDFAVAEAMHTERTEAIREAFLREQAKKKGRA